jgi:hypothetical protein
VSGSPARRPAVEDLVYLRNYRHMMPTGRQEAGFRLMALFAAEVSPPPPLSIKPLDAAATVLRARRDGGAE